MNINRNDEILIKVDNASKRYCKDLKKSLVYGVQDIAYDLLGKNREFKQLRRKEFYANKGINFKVERGECIGLIGHNGAGKTTLLKMLNGLIKPDEGKIEVRGSVGALIALGAGFNPILTGEENVYIAGAVLGLTRKEVQEKYDDIVEFSEMHDYMQSPVQTYSSGMQVKLGFSIASALNPDILIIDEVLAVGDVSFRAKCYNRISEMVKESAVILVSHNMSHIAKYCSKCILLDRGELVYVGDVEEAISLYNAKYINELSETKVSDDLEIIDYSINGCKEGEEVQVNFEDEIKVSIDLNFLGELCEIDISLNFLSSSNEWITETKPECISSSSLNLKKRNVNIVIEIPSNNLGDGKKFVSLIISDKNSGRILVWKHSTVVMHVKNREYVSAYTTIKSTYTIT